MGLKFQVCYKSY